MLVGLSPAAPTHAQNPQSLSLGGELFAADGTLITTASVDFKVQVLDAAGTCVLYAESHPGENLSVSRGRFNLLLGQGSAKVNNLDASATFNAKLFLNSGVTNVANCAQPTVALNAGDARQIRISYDLGSGYAQLTPDVPLVSTAYAMLADSLQGKAAADFIQVADNGSSALTQANTEFAFSLTNWPKLQALLNGTSTQYLPASPSMPVDLNGQRLVNLADPTAAQNAATKNYVDTFVAGKPVDVTGVGPMTGNGSVLRWDATANKWVASVINTSATGTAGGDLQGSYPSPTIKDDAITARKIASLGGGVNRLLITDASTGTTVGYGACALNEVYAWTAGGWACTAVATLAPVTKVAGRTGNVTLTAADIGSLGTAALQDYGTAANQVVRLDASARLPAVDGSLLTNVNATALQGRMIAATAPTLAQVLGFNVSTSQWEPTTLPAANSGSVTSVATSTGLLGGPITASGTLSVDVGSAANKIVRENGSAQIAQTLGTLSAPAYTFAGNENTGLFSPGANQLSMSVGGSPAVNLQANGYLGIGTTTSFARIHAVGYDTGVYTPTSTASGAPGSGASNLIVENKSGVDGSGAFLLLSSQNSSYATDLGYIGAVSTAGDRRPALVIGQTGSTFNTYAELMRFAPNGNVGIGTSAPAAGLDLALTGTTSSAVIVPRDSTAMRPSAPVNGMLRYNNTLNVMEGYINGAWLALAAGASAGTVTSVATSTGLLGGAITTSGTLSVDVGNSANKIVQENTNAQIAQLGGTAALPSYSFAAAPDTGLFSAGAGQVALSAAGVARMSVSSNGGIGMGTSNPTANLYVTSGGPISGLMSPNQRDLIVAQNAANVGDQARIYVISGDSAGAAVMMGGISAPTAGSITYASLNKTLTLASNSINALTINGAGNVGIGTTSAQAGLDIASTGTIASAIIVPRDTTAMRPTVSVNGMLRYNTATSKFEAFENNAWTNLIGGAQPSFPLLANPMGTAAAPAYSFSGNANTGMFSPGAGQVAISANGTAALSVLANGSIGIGTSAPTRALDVAAIVSHSTTGLTSQISVRSPANSTNKLNIGYDTTAQYGFLEAVNEGTTWQNLALQPSGGFVGIGTTTPSVPLDVNGTVRTSQVTLTNGGFNTAQLNNNALSLYDFSGSSSSNAPYVNLRAGRQGGAVSSGDKMGEIAFAGNYNAYAFTTGAKISAFADDVVSASALPTRLSFYTTPAGSLTPVESLRISSSGAVGIGTTAPQAGLDVASTGTIASAIIVPRDTTAMRPSVSVNGMLRYNTATSKFEAFENNAWTNMIGGAQPSFPLFANPMGTAAAPAYSFSGNANTGMFSPGAGQVAISANGTAALTVLASGNVGIGTATPATPLAVTGIAAATTFQSGLGTVTAPSHSFTGATGVGFYSPDSTSVSFTTGGSGVFNFNGSRLEIGNNIPLAWSNGTGTFGSSKDTFLGRTAPNTLSLGNTAAAFNGTLALGSIGIGTAVPAAALDVATTGTIASAIIVPRDTTAMRPTVAVNGMIRYNSATSKFEAFENNAWTNMIGGGSPSFPLLANPIGSAAAPAYSFSGNANTGLYSPGANQVAIATSGTAAMTIAANGDTIFNSTTNSNNANSGAVRVLGGLGVSGQISAGSSVIAPTLIAYAGTGGPYTATSTGLNTPYSTSILISNPVSIDGAVSSLRLQTYNAAAAGQNAYVGAVATTSGFAPSIVFGQSTGSGAYNERMRIDAAGKVGIGSTTPGAMLDVVNPAATNDAARFFVSGQVDGGISVGGSSSVGGAQGMYANAGDLYFKTDSTQRLRITAVGTSTFSNPVNIQTDGAGSASVSLDVNGGIRAGAATVVTATCNSTVEGTQRYNYTTHTMEFCNGTSWLAVTYQNTGTVAPVVVSGPPVSANTYAVSSASANYTPGFGAVANVWDGVFATAGSASNNNASCVRIDGTTTTNQIVLDLGSSKLINNIYFDAGGGGADYILGLSFSTDNVTFTSSVTMSPGGSGNQVTYKTFTLGSSVTARYLRVINAGSAANTFSTLCDVAVGP